MNTLISIVIPCYNEIDVLPETTRRLSELLSGLISSGKIHPDSRVLYVDDGSRDGTWELIEKLYSEYSFVAGLKLSRNRGHQNALFAGLMEAYEKSDAVISMDCDLQDDITAIERMLEKYHNGCDIVYGVRSCRATDTAFKRNTARGFYKLLGAMGTEIIYDHADYRLMSKRALYEFSQFGEVNLYLRGLVPMLGFKSAIVEYERGNRFAGESKYPLKAMLRLAIDAVTSLSVRPLRFIMLTGLIIFLISAFVLLYFFISYIRGNAVDGWASLGVSIWVLGSIQILCMGIIGEYIGKMYLEVKHRPRYIIQTRLFHDE